MRRGVTLWAVMFAVLLPAVARGQGLLVVIDPAQQVRLPRPIIIYPQPIYPHPIPFPPPQPAATYKIDELEVNARLVDQVAQVQVSQTFENTGSRPLEVSFIFPLPYDGAIHQLTLLVDGKEFPARLLDAKEARRIYEEIVRKNRDPALLEWMGTGMFQTSVFPVPPGGKRTVTLRYSQLCRQQEGLTDFLFPLSTAKYTSHPVEKVSVRVSIESREAIKNVYSPTHAVDIHRPDDHHAPVTFTCKNEVPSQRFPLASTTSAAASSAPGAQLPAGPGRRRLLPALGQPADQGPRPEAAQPKTVMFVIDRSGSMSGKKIEQVQAALKFVLNNLHEGDLFNIIAYDSEVESFRPELQRFDDEDPQGGPGLRRGDLRRRQHQHRRRDADRPGPVAGRPAGPPTSSSSPTAFPRPARPTSRRSSPTPRRRTRSTPGSSSSAWATTSTAASSTSWPARTTARASTCGPTRTSRTASAGSTSSIESPVLTGVQLEFALRRSPSRGGQPDRPRLSQGLLRPLRRRATGGRRPLQEAGHGQGGRSAARSAAASRSSTSPPTFDRPKRRRILRLHREALGRPPRGRDHRRAGPQGQERRVGQASWSSLAKQHGILTPYTSFMADENTNLHDVAGQRSPRRAGSA